MDPQEFAIRQGSGYPYILAWGGLAAAPSLFRRFRIDECLVVSNATVMSLYGEALLDLLLPQGIRAVPVVIPEGEHYKNLDTVNRLYRALLAMGATRSTCVAALGGGVVGDIAGFVAATFMRGIPLVHLPTSLLAMVDSSIGGKTAVDLPMAKNLVGAFHFPRFVLADPSTLATLPQRELSCGMAEVVKAALISSDEFFSFLETLESAGSVVEEQASLHIVARASQVKMGIVEEDPYENGKRVLLNLGHTMGHAVEAAGGYERLSHGEGVAVGMVFAVRMARALGILEGDFEARLRALLSRMNLPSALPAIPWEKVEGPLLHDKKRTGEGIRMVLPARPGSLVVREGIPLETVREVYLRMQEEPR